MWVWECMWVRVMDGTREMQVDDFYSQVIGTWGSLTILFL